MSDRKACNSGWTKIALVLLAVLLLAGCGAFGQTIEKDEVRVRPIDKPSEAPETESGRMLSSETARALAVHAIGRFFDLHPAESELSFEILSLDAPSVSQALENLFLFQADTKRKYLIMERRDDERIISPLYFVTVSVASSEKVMVILHAETGDVLGIARQMIDDQDPAPTVQMDMKASTNLANEFLERLGFDLSKMEIEVNFYYGSIIEFFYRAKDSGEIALNVTVNARTSEVIGFLKDVMTLPFLAPYARP